ncbi:MAG: thioredoxin-disulfide reductase [Lachnospiraceae bacterium]|nr:thioredoxin-disulfide reductase [Lachnospiraceae bacterium]
MEHIYDVVIIGGGPAGYTAALYAARAGRDTVILEKLSAGGQMATTAQIDNYPGFDEGVDGFELAMKMQQQAERFGAKTELAEVQEVKLAGEVKEITTDSGMIKGRTVIIATGANPRKMGIAKEDSLIGRGVGYCAHCDGMFYRGKTVAVVGGGNTAAADALLLSRICERVHLVHRREELRATKIYHEPMMQAENIKFHWNAKVVDLTEEGKVTGMVLENVKTGEKETVPCDGVFVSIGREPATELFAGQIDLDESGYILADETTRTNIPGVFAVGDVRQKALRQVVTAVADGAVASHYADEYLAEQA